MKKLPLILFLAAASFFLFLKITNLGVRLSDTNIYFYTAYAILHGKVLYKDIFFTNFPLLPYISVLYFWLTAGNLPLFYLTAPLEAVTVACFIYVLVRQETKNTWMPCLSAVVYLFSFILLSTADHQTGVFLASLFAIVSYYLYKKSLYFWSGVLIALALLTKAYFLPVFVAFFLTLLFTKKRQVLSLVAGIAVAGAIVLLPSLLLARAQFFTDVFAYSLTRSQGLSKTEIGWFFITHDSLFFLLLIAAVVTIRKRLFFGILSISGILFFFLYKDVYYLYLNFLPPFLCLSLPEVLTDLQKRGVQKMIIPTLIFLFLGSNLFIYLSSYRTLQKVPEIQTIVQQIKALHPKALYGTNDITPALSYLTDVPLLHSIIDTNPNIFNKGYLNTTVLTQDAVKQKALIIAHGSYFPGVINNMLTDAIFDQKMVAKSCTLLKVYPVRAEGLTNEIVLYACGTK